MAEEKYEVDMLFIIPHIIDITNKLVFCYICTWQRRRGVYMLILVIRLMTDLLRNFRGSVVIMMGRSGDESHYVHN